MTQMKRSDFENVKRILLKAYTEFDKITNTLGCDKRLIDVAHSFFKRSYLLEKFRKQSNDEKCRIVRFSKSQDFSKYLDDRIKIMYKQMELHQLKLIVKLLKCDGPKRDLKFVQMVQYILSDYSYIPPIILTQK